MARGSLNASYVSLSKAGSQGRGTCAGEGDGGSTGRGRVVRGSLFSQERGTTYPNTMRFKVPYNGDTSRGNEGIGLGIKSFTLEAPDAYPFDSGALS